jgi:hypothetical protein
MDLVDQAGANQITINILSSGLVNIAAIYAWVNAHSVSTIKVAKLYDQTGNGNHFTQATLATMPSLLLSSGLPGGLPVVDMTGGTNAMLATAGNVPATQPFSFTAVYRTSSATGAGIIGGAGSTDASLMSGSAVVGLGTTAMGFSEPASANVYHAVQGVSATGANGSVISSDGVETTGTYSSTIGASVLRFGRNGSGGGTLVGQIAAAGLITSVGLSASQRAALNSVYHSILGF